MASGEDAGRLVGLRPDERLLDEDLPRLPAHLGRPQAAPPSPLRPRVVALGVALTAASLIGGIALLVVGLVMALGSGLGGGAAVAVAAGAILVLTHWGWVHVAEATGNALQNRRERHLEAVNRSWLERIAPYEQLSVVTRPREDGAVSILTLRHRPVPSGPGRFTFQVEVAAEEVHPAEQPAAVVAERAEALRRQAAAATAQQRRRHLAGLESLEEARLRSEDEQADRSGARAASQALSEQINANLQRPPLEED